MAVTVKRRLQRIASTFNAKARRLHVVGSVSWQMLAAVGDRCAYCPTELSLDQGTWDHIIPFDRGGTNEITNIVRCCTSCQRAKFTKSPAEYDAHRELMVVCKNPQCPREGRPYHPRWAEWQNGRARYCSHACAGSAKGKGA